MPPLFPQPLELSHGKVECGSTDKMWSMPATEPDLFKRVAAILEERDRNGGDIWAAAVKLEPSFVTERL